MKEFFNRIYFIIALIPSVLIIMTTSVGLYQNPHYVFWYLLLILSVMSIVLITKRS
jgi:hypothetical protein